MALAEVLNVFRMLAAVHPLLGWLFVAAVAILLISLVGIPAVRFLSLSAVAIPPKMPDDRTDVTHKNLTKRLNYLARYLRGLRRNPLLAESVAEIDSVIETVKKLKRNSGKAGNPLFEDVLKEIEALEREKVEKLLRPLDQKVDKAVYSEALSVGVATAVSFNGTMDALIILWRNMNMISKIGKTYYGRPGPLGVLRILGDVLAASLAGAYLQNLSEFAGGALANWLGSLAGVIAGPVVDGTANALVTLRVGYLAKARCRSFRAWTPASRRDIFRACFEAARKQSREVVRALTSIVGGVFGGRVVSAAGGLKAGLQGAWDYLRGKDRT
jgi:uncharacterized membrane protein YcjF (UPF0283 family)